MGELNNVNVSRQIILTIVLTIFLVKLSLGQLNWEKAAINTPTGLEIFVNLYDSSFSLPLQKRIAFYKKGFEAAIIQQNNEWAAEFAYAVAEDYLLTDSLSQALLYINEASAKMDKESRNAVYILNHKMFSI